MKVAQVGIMNKKIHQLSRLRLHHSFWILRVLSRIIRFTLRVNTSPLRQLCEIKYHLSELL